MKQNIAIIGAGPAALALAAFLDKNKYAVTIYEKNKTAGRKFLVAGKGGFNLTHSETIETFTQQYTPDTFLKDALEGFSNQQFMNWLKSIGIPTFIGSSKRVYPEKGIKPIEVLNTMLKVLEQKKVQIVYGEEWTGWNKKGALLFSSGLKAKADICVFALGGGSWKVTGSDGSWLDTFAEKGIETRPFEPANCAYEINWPESFISKAEGKPLKNLRITCDSKMQKGEVVITKFGLEGNAIYGLSPQIQSELNANKEAKIFLDLKPTIDFEKIHSRVQKSKEKRITDILRNTLNLSPTQIHLLKSHLDKETFLNKDLLSKNIKELPLTIKSAAPIDEAISTTGGISLNAVSDSYELDKMKNTFVIGEMLDWNAPTGGYLLQACFSMGARLADHLNAK